MRVRQGVIHYRLKRKGNKFELQALRWKPKRLLLIEQQKCRRCGTTICVWASAKLSLVVAKSKRNCCNGFVLVTIKLSQNHCR